MSMCPVLRNCIVILILIYFLLTRNGVEVTGFLWISIYPALRNCILTLIFIFFIMEEWCGICEFLVHIYVLHTKKLNRDPDFHIFDH